MFRCCIIINECEATLTKFVSLENQQSINNLLHLDQNKRVVSRTESLCWILDTKILQTYRKRNPTGIVHLHGLRWSNVEIGVVFPAFFVDSESQKMKVAVHKIIILSKIIEFVFNMDYKYNLIFIQS